MLNAVWSNVRWECAEAGFPPEARTQEHPVSEAALRGYLKSSGPERSDSQAFVPPDPKDDGAPQDTRLLRGTVANAAFPPQQKQATR